jgi:hypothetical protein
MLSLTQNPKSSLSVVTACKTINLDKNDVDVEDHFVFIFWFWYSF